jgi:hypothetical protein
MATRIDNYTYRLNPTRIMEDITAKKPDMVAQETTIFSELQAIEEHVRGVLSGETAASIQYPFYQAFAKEVWKVHRHYGGGNVVIDEVALLVSKWKTRGLTESVLNKIRDEVFGIPAPTP